MMNERDDIFTKEMDYFVCKFNSRRGCANLIANTTGKLKYASRIKTNTISFSTKGKIYTWDFFFFN